MSKPTIKPGPLADDVKKASERVAEWEGARGDVTLESLARAAAAAYFRDFRASFPREMTVAGYVEMEWHAFVNQASAVLRALEPVFAEAWREGWSYSDCYAEKDAATLSEAHAADLITRLCGENKDTGNG